MFEAAKPAKKYEAPFWDVEGDFTKPDCAGIQQPRKAGQCRQKILEDRRFSRAKF